MLPSGGHVGNGLIIPCEATCPTRVTTTATFMHRVKESAAAGFICTPLYTSRDSIATHKLPSAVNMIRARLNLRERRTINVTIIHKLARQRRRDAIDVYSPSAIMVSMRGNPVVIQIKLAADWQGHVVQGDLSYIRMSLQEQCRRIKDTVAQVACCPVIKVVVSVHRRVAACEYLEIICLHKTQVGISNTVNVCCARIRAHR